MVFGLVTSEDDFMPKSIFSHDLTLDAEGYINFQEEEVLTWIEKMVVGKPYVWKQDSAQCHTRMKSQCWL